MVSAHALWKRIETAFRGHDPHALPAINVPSPLKVVTADPPEARPRRFQFPWGRSAKAALEERYQRVGQAIEALERHFDQQDRRAEQLVGAVEHVARNLSDLSSQQRRTQETLQAMNLQLTRASEHLGKCSVAFVELPAAMQAQADAVRSTGRQLDSMRQTQADIGGALRGFNTSLDALRSAGLTQVESLERMHLESYDDRRALQNLIRVQQQRFLIVMIVTAAISIGAMIAAAAFVVLATRP